MAKSPTIHSAFIFYWNEKFMDTLINVLQQFFYSSKHFHPHPKLLQHNFRLQNFEVKLFFYSRILAGAGLQRRRMDCWDGLSCPFDEESLQHGRYFRAADDAVDGAGAARHTGHLHDGRHGGGLPPRRGAPIERLPAAADSAGRRLVGLGGPSWAHAGKWRSGA